MEWEFWSIQYFFYFRWLRFSAFWGLVLYLLIQVFGVWMERYGVASVAYLGHLGGLVVGIV